jgi:hypothetical protein
VIRTSQVFLSRTTGAQSILAYTQIRTELFSAMVPVDEGEIGFRLVGHEPNITRSCFHERQLVQILRLAPRMRLNSILSEFFLTLVSQEPAPSTQAPHLEFRPSRKRPKAAFHMSLRQHSWSHQYLCPSGHPLQRCAGPAKSPRQ